MSTEAADQSRRIMRVRWFDRRRGYGFLVPVTQSLESDTQDDTVFVYHNELRAMYMSNIFRMLYAGEYVECEISTDDKGRTVAKHVTGVQDGPLMCEVRAQNTQSRDTGDGDDDEVDARPAPRRRTGGYRGNGSGRGGAPRRTGGRSGARPAPKVADTSGMDA